MAISVTGASGAIPRNDIKRMDEHAALYYEEIRNRTSDIKSIAKNTGFTTGEIETIKNHIFFNQYDLDGKRLKRFDPDYDMAVSWQRLIDGNEIKEMDIVLLKHELMEYGLMEQGMSYNEAHRITEKTYNYKKYTDKLDKIFKDKIAERGKGNE
jgi:hypothetical protein